LIAPHLQSAPPESTPFESIWQFYKPLLWFVANSEGSPSHGTFGLYEALLRCVATLRGSVSDGLFLLFTHHLVSFCVFVSNCAHSNIQPEATRRRMQKAA
ncbi:MAG: hypothetical protein ACLFWB_06390, partial [Armatimonadota bacterium]